MLFWWTVPVYAGLVGFAKADLAGDIVDAMQGAGSCAGCHALLLPLKFLAMWGDSPFVSTITAVCKALKIVDADVCEGAIKLQGPILANDLRSIDAFGLTATKLCDALFGLCQAPDVNDYRVQFPKAAPQVSRRVQESFKSPRRPPFQVVHFSDIHIDREYTPGSDAKCSKPICCRMYADQKGPIAVAAGGMGHHNCDTPPVLARSMLEAISATNAFSIFTGDVSEASVWLSNEDAIRSNMNAFSNDLASVLRTPVFPAVGNHESSPTNSFPRNTTSKSSAQWVFDTLSQGWLPFIDQPASEQASHMSGSYSAIVPGTHLKIISLNTLYWYKNNYWLYDSDQLQPDPNGILQFLIEQLQSAEDAGQRAWIIGHMPPGAQDALHDQSNYFDQVVQRYHRIISGQFYGHTHQDQFVLAYSDYEAQTAENAVNVGWIAPAITPRGGNPAFKVYDVDPDTYEIMDSRVFRADLASVSFQTQPSWELYYSAREIYGPFIGGWPAEMPLNPAFWHKVTEAFEQNEAAFQTYLTFRRRGVGIVNCDSTCKDRTICGIRALRAENNCGFSTPGLNFRRRSIDINPPPPPPRPPRHSHTSEIDNCEGTDIGKILTTLLNSLETSDDFMILEQSLRDAMPDVE